ncbi:MAG TPA: retropepsin-like aspartic protease [Bacteroidales bacterium]|nr:retropepsin-like aspartic protease [Bacteroidales bacterium]
MNFQVKFIFIPFLFLSTFFAYGQTDHPSFPAIYQMITENDYFRAAALFDPVKEELPETYRLVAGAFLDNAFNRLESSQEQIDLLLGKGEGKAPAEGFLPDSLLMELYSIREDNAIKMYDYAKARDAAMVQLERFGHLLDGPGKENVGNNLTLWSALSEVPTQRITIEGYTVLELQKDIAGLDNITVSAGGETLGFIFDTGANLSTVCKSVAENMGMDIIPVEIQVGSITGEKVPAQLAVCEQMSIGKIVVKNIVFLVFPDDQLSFPQVGYKISGILGYPVIEAFGEIQITREGTMIIPQEYSAFSGPSNMAMDGLTPLICLEGDPYTFDTGADHTMLYAAYYQDNREIIEESCKPEKVTFGGAGGIREFDGFVIDKTFNISGKEITVEGIHLLKEKIKETETVYGNIGQDIMGQFSKMILNFDRMFILFE